MVTSETGKRIKFDETAAISGYLCIIRADSIDFATLGACPDFARIYQSNTAGN